MVRTWCFFFLLLWTPGFNPWLGNQDPASLKAKKRREGKDPSAMTEPNPNF